MITGLILLVNIDVPSESGEVIQGCISYAGECAPPASGDWIVTESCTLLESASVKGNVYIQDEAVLTIGQDGMLRIGNIENNVTPGAWSGEGLSFTVTSDGRIQDLTHTYAGLCNCKFTIDDMVITSNNFSLHNTGIGFALNGAFIDATHMSAQISVNSPDCALSNETITAEKVPPFTVVSSFDSPGGYPTGLTFDGTYLWNADWTRDKIYKLDTSGSMVDSFDSPGPTPYGLAFDGTYLWNVDADDNKIYKLDTSGNIIDSFDSLGTALTFDGTYLWTTDTSEDKIYKLDTSGNIIDSFDSPGPCPIGLTFDGTYLWNADCSEDKIYKLDTSGNIIDSFDSPGSSPSGLAFDGAYLWHVDKSEDKIYKIAIE